MLAGGVLSAVAVVAGLAAYLFTEDLALQNPVNAAVRLPRIQANRPRESEGTGMAVTDSLRGPSPSVHLNRPRESGGTGMAVADSVGVPRPFVVLKIPTVV